MLKFFSRAEISRNGNWSQNGNVGIGIAAKLSVEPKKMFQLIEKLRSVDLWHLLPYPGCPGVGAIFSIFRASLPSTG